MIAKTRENIVFTVFSLLLAVLAMVVVLVSVTPTAMAIYIASVKHWSELSVALLFFVLAANGFLLLSAYKTNQELLGERVSSKKSEALLYFMAVAALGAALVPLVF